MPYNEIERQSPQILREKANGEEAENADEIIAPTGSHCAESKRASTLALPTGGNEWTEEHVRKMLTNPIYGYGIVLEPFDAVTDAVSRYEQVLAHEQRRRGQPYSLDELDQRFQVLFADLVKRGICRRGPDAPPAVPKEMWLSAQQVTIRRLADGEPT